MDTLFGLPAHPLLVHIPIVLLPLAAIGVLVMVAKPAWHRRYRWAVLSLGIGGALGAVLAASAGEELEGRIVGIEGREAAASWEHHSQLGETARTVSLVFLAVLVIFVLVPWWMERRSVTSIAVTSTGVEGAGSEGSGAAPSAGMTRDRSISVALAIVAVATATWSVVTVIQAGHSGSKSVWSDVVDPPSGG